MSDADPEAARDAILVRHAEERTELGKRTERMRSAISRKDRTGRARAAEDAEKEASALARRHAAEAEAAGCLGDVTEAVADVELGPEAGTGAGDAGARKESKAARRRRVKAEKEAESERRVAEEKASMGPTDRFVETEAIEKQLKPNGFVIHPIPPDGHCVYAAVAHQMQLYADVREFPVESSVKALRAATAAHLLAHRDDYIPFIESVDGDPALYAKYCEELRSKAVWGGQVELRAITQFLGVIIEVYAADIPVVRMGTEQTVANGATVFRLSFHRKYYRLGEHYNSVFCAREDS